MVYRTFTVWINIPDSSLQQSILDRVHDYSFLWLVALFCCHTCHFLHYILLFVLFSHCHKTLSTEGKRGIVISIELVDNINSLLVFNNFITPQNKFAMDKKYSSSFHELNKTLFLLQTYKIKCWLSLPHSIAQLSTQGTSPCRTWCTHLVGFCSHIGTSLPHIEHCAFSIPFHKLRNTEKYA